MNMKFHHDIYLNKVDNKLLSQQILLKSDPLGSIFFHKTALTHAGEKVTHMVHTIH